jgi:hypothetical protein
MGLETVPLPQARRSSSESSNESVVPGQRSRTTNDPLSRCSRYTKTGRRIRDLFLEFSHHLGRPRSPTTEAELLALAELTTLAERKREQALRDEPDSDKWLDNLIRLEAQVARRRRRLGLDRTKPPAPAPTLAEYLRSKQEAAE